MVRVPAMRTRPGFQDVGDARRWKAWKAEARQEIRTGDGIGAGVNLRHRARILRDVVAEALSLRLLEAVVIGLGIRRAQC